MTSNTRFNMISVLDLSGKLCCNFICRKLGSQTKFSYDVKHIVIGGYDRPKIELWKLQVVGISKVFFSYSFYFFSPDRFWCPCLPIFGMKNWGKAELMGFFFFFLWFGWVLQSVKSLFKIHQYYFIYLN